MTEPSRRTSRLALAGGIGLALAIGGGGFLLGRESAPRAAAPAPGAAPAIPVVNAPAALPQIDTRLGRADLLDAARAAADAFASGRPPPESLDALSGRAFELRLPFGCPGAPPAADHEMRYDPEEQSLRVAVSPVQWSPAEWLPPASGADGQAGVAESVEGFWIPRPWTTSEACPPQPTAAAPPVAPPMLTTNVTPAPQPAQSAASHQQLALGQFFLPGGSRVGRRDGEAYRAVARIAPAALDLDQGLRLRLRGEIVRSPAGPVLLCRGVPTSPPACLLSVSWAEIAIQNAATGETLATWDVASRSASAQE